jgi:hypothetical protein
VNLGMQQMQMQLVPQQLQLHQQQPMQQMQMHHQPIAGNPWGFPLPRSGFCTSNSSNSSSS